eukprot:TRINITY_DN8492_c0_g1_i1.p1 TRINITY_DN8492_c0_g1~~TRINITY_DN8492_c0_g1_i1.p1  ORF type:complete len:251 (+),score=21.96 TRINITY_DN8492_c0_g1_i1:131-883(+)
MSVAEAPSSSGKNDRYPKKCAPVEHLTTKQLLSLIFMHSIGAGILDGAINFGIACAMYKGASHVSLWYFPNTLAGDIGVTIIIQSVLTYILDGMLSSKDARNGVIPPLEPKRWMLNSRGIVRWFVATSMDLLEPKLTGKVRAKRFGRMLACSLIYTVLVFLVFWPIGIAILAGIGGSGGLRWDGWPWPEIFKGLFGFGMGVIQTPFITVLAWKRMGWIQLYEEQPASDFKDSVVISTPKDTTKTMVAPPS